MSALPKTSREVRLAATPESIPGPEHFELVSVLLPTPKPGEALIRNQYFRVSASVRMMVSKDAEQVEGVPFPPLRPGDTLFEECVGEVVSAPADSGLSPGDKVLHSFGWREYATVPVRQCLLLNDILPDPVAHLGHGWTAYAALTRGVQIRPGDTVFVSSAAGAIGSMAGPIARLLGAGRVIGSTSSNSKAERLVSELGYDAAVVRDRQSIVEQLSEIAPEGVDVYLDTVGGPQLQAAMKAANVGARFVLVGALSGQLAVRGTGRTAPVELDSFQLILKKITMRGYSADDDPEVRDEWTRRFSDWLRSGEIRFPHTKISGIENASRALKDAADGRYFGVVVVEV